MVDVPPEKLEMRKRAIQLARNAGKQWREIGKEERRVFLQQARRGGPDPSGSKVLPAKQAARAAAIKDGRKWRDLSKEERQKYLAQVRGK